MNSDQSAVESTDTMAGTIESQNENSEEEGGKGLRILLIGFGDA